MSSSHKQEVLYLRAFRDWRHFLATGCGFGCLPWIPGTWGTLPAVFIFWAIGGLSVWTLAGITAAMFLVGIPLTAWVAWDMQRDDPGQIVWDEWVGYFVTVLLVPHSWQWLWIGFGLFRLFDWFKLPFIAEVERRTKGGWSIMLDDVMAGILAGLGIVILRETGILWLVVYLLFCEFLYFGDVEESRKTVNRIHQSHPTDS